jgi:hypothetical protein
MAQEASLGFIEARSGGGHTKSPWEHPEVKGGDWITSE